MNLLYFLTTWSFFPCARVAIAHLWDEGKGQSPFKSPFKSPGQTVISWDKFLCSDIIGLHILCEKVTDRSPQSADHPALKLCKTTLTLTSDIITCVICHSNFCVWFIFSPMALGYNTLILSEDRKA